MRTLKFRAWHPEWKRFVYFDQLHLFWDTHAGGYRLVSNQETNETYCQFDPSQVTIQQFTGLKDKNEQEIYEGDILQIPDEEVENCVRSPYGHVWFGEHSAEYMVSYNHLYSEVADQLWNRNHDSVVVGNIHQNPEFINYT
jgi:uncharacterized phage protein (TIGR01671 family)